MATKAKWESQRAIIFDNEEFEHVHPFNPILFYDDFMGAYTVIPAAAAAESGCNWIKTVVGTGTVAALANTAQGVVECDAPVAAAEQEAILYMDDDRRFLITQGVVFEARVKLSVLPTTDTEMVWGLAGDYSKGPDTVTFSIWFSADGSGEIFCEKDDDNTDQSVTSGVTVTNAQWKVYRIDCRDVTSIKFYINGVRVATGTTFPYIATGADATLQPYIGAYKLLNGTGTLLVDYVRIWGNRS